MTHVATLISNPAAPALDDTVLARARAALPAAKDPIWLDPGIAADIPFTPAAAEVIEKRIALTPGGKTLVATMRAHGAYTCLVSGGFTLFTQKIGAMIGFDEDRSNILLVDGDARLSGQVAEPILGKEAKLETLRELQTRLGLAPEETMAIGDGANDIPMIEAAGLGVAYPRNPAVAEAAAARIEHGDLTALLYAQGYPRAAFVNP